MNDTLIRKLLIEYENGSNIEYTINYETISNDINNNDTNNNEINIKNYDNMIGKSFNIKNIETNYICNICFDDIKENDNVRKLIKCNHIFHKKCIDTWLKKKLNCPICRCVLNKNKD